MTTLNLKIEMNYREGAGHFIYIYTVKGRAKTKKILYETLQKFTTKEKAEEYMQNLKITNKDIDDEYDYITISRDIVWID